MLINPEQVTTYIFDVEGLWSKQESANDPDSNNISSSNLLVKQV
jgi:hypothetical protein